MTIKTLAAKGVSRRAIGWQLGLSEGTVRYHLRRQAAGAEDGRARQPRSAILDRLLHNAHIMNIKGRTYRLRDLENALASRKG
ncbi:MAG: ATP-binding protein [Woeseia sp.]